MNDQKVKRVFQTTLISICSQNESDQDHFYIVTLSCTSHLPMVYGIIYVKDVQRSR